MLSREKIKEKIRQLVRQRRREITGEKKRQLSKQAAEQAIAWSSIDEAHNIAVFMSFDGELDTRPLIERLWDRGKRVYLPALHPTKLDSLLFLRYHMHTEIVINRLKIREPKLDVKNIFPVDSLDVLISPLVAFNRQGQRLGMGGGFYDRTIKDWSKYGFKPVGYAYDCQLVDSLPEEEWDVPLPTIITPSKLWFF